jgi:integrase
MLRALRLDEEMEKEIIGGRSRVQLAETLPTTLPGHHARHRHAVRRELYRIRIENLDLENHVIFVPDSKTQEGRRRVRMSNRTYDVLKRWCIGRREGWVFPSKRTECAYLTTMAKRSHANRVNLILGEPFAVDPWRPLVRIGPG